MNITIKKAKKVYIFLIFNKEYQKIFQKKINKNYKIIIKDLYKE